MNIDKESTPQSNNDPAYGEINFFSPGSRINRLRYWAHSMLVIIPFYIVAGLGAALALNVSWVFWGIVAIAYIGLVVFSFILIIQRLHDLDKSGWFSLLALVPLANIYLIVLLVFFAGTPGRNTYGLPTPPNKTWHWILALGFPVLFIVLAILAAVALPAYQGYVMRAQQEQIQNMETPDYDALEGEVLEEEPIEGEEALGEEGALDEENAEAVGDEENLEDGEPVEDEVVEEDTLDETADGAATPEAEVAPEAVK